jgi:predicted nuclease of predicted toxin-antitoxin system
MTFLFDQSTDFRLIPHLQALGHDVSAISRNYPHGLADADVLAIARDEQRILLVADRDFGELIFQQGLAHAGVIFFRLPGASLPTKIGQLNRTLNECKRSQGVHTGNAQYIKGLQICSFLG